MKAYGDVGRPVTKPVGGSVRVAVDGLELAEDAFAVDSATGVVTLGVAPLSGAAVTAGFLFDVPVRFDSDRLEVTLESFGAGRIAAAPLIEIRV